MPQPIYPPRETIAVVTTGEEQVAASLRIAYEGLLYMTG
jgi:hypothetical protein